MKTKLLPYLLKNYSPGEPIFYKDISIGSSADSMRHQFAMLLKTGKIAKYGNGTFFLPKKSLLGGEPFISTDAVVFSKYISRKDGIIGYYSGLTFANQLGVTYQVPVVKEIVSNNCSSNARKIALNGREYQIRKPKFKVTDENHKVLQLLSFLENYRKYTDYESGDASEKVRAYTKSNGITQEQLFKHAGNFNRSVYKTIIELGL